MAQGKYSRVDGRKSSCSTATIVVVVGVCLVGVWMFMSSSAAPGQNLDLPSAESRQKVSTKSSSQFEDNSGDLPDDAVKDQENTSSEGDTNSDEKESNTNDVETNTGDDSSSSDEKSNSEDTNSNSDSNESEKSNSGDNDSNSDTNETEKSDEAKDESQSEEKVEKEEEKQAEEKQAEESSSDNKTEDLSAATQSEILKESNTQNGAFSTQAAESESEKESQKPSLSKNQEVYKWKTCNVTAGPDYIPCLDNLEAIRHLHGRSHYEHRERHCPAESPTCLVSLPEGYKTPIKWPRSREQIWYSNVPHTKLAAVKGHQNWVKVTGDYLSFPGGGTQFKNGALHYIDFIQNSLPDLAWGNRTRVILDVGCGVASFGGYLFERDVVALSFAPKDEHEAQVQFALERGIPAISAVMGTQRLPFPSKIFDVVHCARCRVPWHIEGGKLLLELNRVLRPGGYFVWSATPVYQNKPEDVEIWEVRGSKWPKRWPKRLESPPYWLKSSEVGVYGKPAPEDFTADYENWKRVVSKSYLNGLGID
ncbi:putative S-adenosyl-L-methionine-dependent methyltransferase [Cynara cardunculus var. scolymus]|uniref:Methyltransferase n=1 Tax=Cynara cardunculus var. scolymus TaxID=59895 RepID=A0A103XXU1_CYNCS|nr:putative S-adenosyl-L-methionine-dependent methyltransferase [Cynara cardunculus var. scolymus]